MTRYEPEFKMDAEQVREVPPEQSLWAAAVHMMLYDWTRIHVVRQKRKLTVKEREDLRDIRDCIFEEPIENSVLYHMLEAAVDDCEAAAREIRTTLFSRPLAYIKKFPSLLDVRFWN